MIPTMFEELYTIASIIVPTQNLTSRNLQASNAMGYRSCLPEKKRVTIGVAMTSDPEGSRPSHLMTITNAKHHPNNTKADQLLIFEVINGLPRPYYNTSPP